MTDYTCGCDVPPFCTIHGNPRAPVSLMWPSDQDDPEHVCRAIETLRSRDLELSEFHAMQLSIANMLAIMLKKSK